MSGAAAAVWSRPSGRAAYAAAAWSFVFAVRGAYWALGGTVGLGTLSVGIREAAAAGDRLLFAALWVTVGFELVAGGLALALARPVGATLPRRLPVVGGRPLPAWLLLPPAWGAGTLLAGHGALFVGFGAITVARGGAVSSELRWYTFFWGPWFLLGGALFLAAGWSYLRRVPNCRRGAAASALGVAGGLVATAAPVVVSALA